MTLFKNKYRVETSRLKGWDYRNAGYYFVTLCTQDRHPFFGEINDGFVRLSAVGEIAHQFWIEIPAHHQDIVLDVFVIMPNHIHGIIIILKPDMVETLHATSLQLDATSLQLDATSPQNPTMSGISPKPGSLGATIRSYKSAVTYWARHHGQQEFAWQSRYHDHIIRNEKSFRQIRQYILDNPMKWKSDQENPANRSIS